MAGSDDRIPSSASAPAADASPALSPAPCLGPPHRRRRRADARTPRVAPAPRPAVTDADATLGGCSAACGSLLLAPPLPKRNSSTSHDPGNALLSSTIARGEIRWGRGARNSSSSSNLQRYSSPASRCSEQAFQLRTTARCPSFGRKHRCSYRGCFSKAMVAVAAWVEAPCRGQCASRAAEARSLKSSTFSCLIHLYSLRACMTMMGQCT